MLVVAEVVEDAMVAFGLKRLLTLTSTGCGGIARV